MTQPLLVARRQQLPIIGAFAVWTSISGINATVRRATSAEVELRRSTDANHVYTTPRGPDASTAPVCKWQQLWRKQMTRDMLEQTELRTLAPTPTN